MVALLKSEPTIALSLTAPTKELAKVIAALARVADRRSSLPMLANVLIRGTRDGVILAATDLNLTLTVRAPSQWGAWSGPGVCVNAKALADLVKSMPGPETSLTPFGSGLRVTSGTAATTLHGTPDRDFPKIPAAHDETRFVACDGPTLADMLDRVLFSACQDETRFHLNGVFCEGHHKSLRMVSTDGHRLTYLDESLWIGTDSPISASGVILPSRAGKELAKLLGKGACDVAIQGPHMFVTQGGWTLAAKLIDAQFPPYRQVIPTDHPRVVTVPRKQLLASLKRAKQLTSDTRGVRFELDAGKLTLVSDHPDLGTASEAIPADTKVSGYVIGLNPKYLIEILSEIEGESVTLTFGAELDPVIIRATDDFVSRSVRESRYLGVVMPMRV